MKPSNLFNSDDRAVSPVIGVILMVAITVILAAVIGTFVLGLGDSLGDSQPTAQISVDVDEATNQTTITHDGGDSINSEALQVVVTGEGSQRVEQSDLFADRFSVGDSVTLNVNAGTDGAGGSITANEDVRVRIIHQSSDSILLDRTIEATESVTLGDQITEV